MKVRRGVRACLVSLGAVELTWGGAWKPKYLKTGRPDMQCTLRTWSLERAVRAACRDNKVEHKRNNKGTTLLAGAGRGSVRPSGSLA